MNRLSAAVLGAFVSAMFVLTGCSAGIVNKGGDTTCKEYQDLDNDKQRSAVEKMVNDRKGEEGANLEVSVVQAAVEAYCKTVGTSSSKISEADLS
ncbi:hypothetical protein ABQE69_00350 [Mycolicibacillus trivialis]|uniref:DUF732 domain-containing protein n=1 Tax=Mycolicibacillus trivialis TaxID=1798 RepID=A0A1X2EP32_9MYCO|nr:hypothetical protein [Mycolicibacillus trivialis]ORX07535.1 hypothetical protein AWC30_04535 [Mycolicibacillus trivialis]